MANEIPIKADYHEELEKLDKIAKHYGSGLAYWTGRVRGAEAGTLDVTYQEYTASIGQVKEAEKRTRTAAQELHTFVRNILSAHGVRESEHKRYQFSVDEKKFFRMPEASSNRIAPISSPIIGANGNPIHGIS